MSAVPAMVKFAALCASVYVGYKAGVKAAGLYHAKSTLVEIEEMLQKTPPLSHRVRWDKLLHRLYVLKKTYLCKKGVDEVAVLYADTVMFYKEF